MKSDIEEYRRIADPGFADNMMKNSNTRIHVKPKDQTGANAARTDEDRIDTVDSATLSDRA